MIPDLADIGAQQSYPIAALFLLDKRVDSANRISEYASVDNPSVPFIDDIVSLPNPNYTLSYPLRVVVDYEEDYYIVGDSTFLRYATGSTIAEAKENYAHSLLGYYKDLRELEGCLAPHLARDLQELRNVIVHRKLQ